MANADRPDQDVATAVGLLEAALAPAALVRVPVRSARDSDSEVIVTPSQGSGKPARLVLQVAGDDPREKTDRAPARVAVLVLRRASVARLRELREADRQFVDVARGAVRIRLPWLFVDRSDVRARSLKSEVTKRGFRNPFGDRASLVTRLLVEHPERSWGARELATAAGVSTMTASHVVRQLYEMGAVEVRSSGRTFAARIRDVRTLVEHWTRHYDWKRNEALPVQAPVGDSRRFLRRLGGELAWHRPWALTLQAGASLVAPHTVFETIHVYLDVPHRAALAEVAEASGWQPGSGKVVLLRPEYDDSIWSETRRIDGIPIVSDLQLVLDLWHYPVRGREQAEVILGAMEKRIAARRKSPT